MRHRVELKSVIPPANALLELALDVLKVIRKFNCSSSQVCHNAIQVDLSNVETSETLSLSLRRCELLDLSAFELCVTFPSSVAQTRQA